MIRWNGIVYWKRYNLRGSLPYGFPRLPYGWDLRRLLLWRMEFEEGRLFARGDWDKGILFHHWSLCLSLTAYIIWLLGAERKDCWRVWVVVMSHTLLSIYNMWMIHSYLVKRAFLKPWFWNGSWCDMKNGQASRSTIIKARWFFWGISQLAAILCHSFLIVQCKDYLSPT